MKTISRRQLIIGGFGVGLLILLVGMWILGGAAPSKNLPRVRIGLVDLTGLTRSEASERVSDAASTAEISLAIDDEDQGRWQLSETGIQIETDLTAERAFDLFNPRSRLRAAWYWVRSWLFPVDIEAVLSVDATVLSGLTGTVASRVSYDEQDAGLQFESDTWQVVSSRSGKNISPESIENTILARARILEFETIELATSLIAPLVSTADAEGLLSYASQLTAQPINLVADEEVVTIDSAQLAAWTELIATARTSEIPVSLRLNQSKVKAYVKILATKFNQEANDALLSFTGGQVQIVQESRMGRILDEDEAVLAISAAFLSETGRQVTLTFSPVSPVVSSSTLGGLGLNELIGTATTSYVGSPENREHNIANGAKFLTGKLVKPGEEFSTVTALGKIDDTTGYLPELVIKENKTTPEFGGGLCQVSTTLFRAAMAAGLKITERQNHSYRVSYYEKVVGPGLDATIYLPSPDLKFLNDTPGWILVQATVDLDKDEITFELYGTKDGRRSEIGKPQITDVTEAPPAVYVDTPDLPRGEVKQIEKPHQGAKTTVTYRVFRGDELVFEQIFKSNYKAWAAKYLVGTAEPTPLPESTPAQDSNSPAV